MAARVGTETGLTFGGLLRRHRASAGVTQQDLADRTGLTPQAIGLLERGERRYPQAYTVRKLAEVLGLEGRDLAEFAAAARRTSGTRPPPARRVLPVPPTPLVGRGHEAAVASDLLARGEVRLLTLTGPGGVGKTRLALEVAGRMADGSFADGVIFVTLAPLRDANEVPAALAEALGIKEAAGLTLRETLERALRDARMLVVLDNFEHLLEAASTVADLLSACPGLKVLATSRAPLRLSSEYQFPVPPLALPGPEGTGGSSALPARTAAVELFVQRAVAVAPGFELTEANAEAAARICRRLDGLPLAIELAAARIKLFPPKALLERLDSRLRVLAGGARDLPERQRTLRDAISWSHDLLDTQERTLFRRLSVFAGGCTLEAAEAVCDVGGEGRVSDALETLSSLVDNSLLVSGGPQGGEGGEPRFTMLETIREFASEMLRSSGEAQTTHRAHALHYLALAEATQPETFMLARHDRWWTRIEEEHDNLRAALRWAVRSREQEIGARFGSLLWRFWAARHPGEGRRWLEAVLALGEAGETESALPARRRAFLLLVAGILASRLGDLDRAVSLEEESLALYRAVGHEKGTHAPLRELGNIAYQRGDYDRAVRLSGRSLAIARRFDSASGAGLAVCTLSDALRAQGKTGQARTLLQESLVSLRNREPQPYIVNAIVNTLARLGSMECEAGDDARAARSYEESLRLTWRFVGRAYESAACLEGLARVSAMQGRPERAARLLGASAAWRDEAGTPLPPVFRADHDHASNAAREALGGEAFEAAWAAGHDAPLEESIAYALDGARLR